MTALTPPWDFTDLADLPQCDAILFDAFGVLVDAEVALPGAQTLLELCETIGLPWAVCTNDASKSAEQLSASYRQKGLTVPHTKIFCSGHLLADWATGASARSQHLRCAFLGPEGSRDFLCVPGVACERLPLPWDKATHGFDAIVVCDDDCGNLIEALDQAVSIGIAGVKANRPPTLVVPNPDFVYPKRDAFVMQYGITAGAMAHLIQTCVEKATSTTLPLIPLGKPSPKLLQKALQSLSLDRSNPFSQPWMVGDQWRTDVVSGLAAACDVVWVNGSRSVGGRPDAAQASDARKKVAQINALDLLIARLRQFEPAPQDA